VTRARVATALAGCSAAALVAATLIHRYAAPAPAHYFLVDQPRYLDFARHPFAVAHVDAPHTWRVLAPLAARGIGEIVGGGPERGFLVLTFASLALMPIAVFSLLRALSLPTDASLWGAALATLTPTLLGTAAWDVVRVDAFATLLIALSAWAAVRGSPTLIVLSMVALALTKETVLVAALFALAWATLVNRRLLGAAIASLAAAIVIRGIWLPHIMPAEHPVGAAAQVFQFLAASQDPRYVMRRLLLATATTWNVMLPAVAVSAAASIRNRRVQALLVGVTVAEAQIFFASDTERLVAAGYPFVIALCTRELATLDVRTRQGVGAALVLLQVPWLLTFGRLASLDWLRGVEVAIALVSAALAAWHLRRGAASPAPEWA
jgi:hypothetical protein